MTKKIDYFNVILKIIVLLGVILLIYWFIKLIFGGSPTLSQFNAGLIFVLIGLIVQIYYKIGKFSQFVDGVFPRFEKNIESSFTKIKQDIELIKNDLSSIKKKLK